MVALFSISIMSYMPFAWIFWFDRHCLSFLLSCSIHHGDSIFVTNQGCILLVENLCYYKIEAVLGVILGTMTLHALDALTYNADEFL